MDVSDQLQMLTRAVQSLDSGRDGGRRSTDCHTSSRRCRERSGLGVQVARMVPISRVRMLGAISTDGRDCWLGRSSTTPVGHSPGGLVLLMMLVSLAPGGSATMRCVSCG